MHGLRLHPGMGGGRGHKGEAQGLGRLLQALTVRAHRAMGLQHRSELAQQVARILRRALHHGLHKAPRRVRDPGRGKTHLAVAIGYRAIQNGFTARFVGASALIDELGAASRVGRLREATAAWVEPDVLIVDEVGYLNHADDAANVLFGVVDHRYLVKKPMIFTTNKKLREWGQVLHDRDLSEVILDRVLERGQQIKLGGRSWRTRHIEPGLFADDDGDPEIVRKVGSVSEEPED